MTLNTTESSGLSLIVFCCYNYIPQLSAFTNKQQQQLLIPVARLLIVINVVARLLGRTEVSLRDVINKGQYNPTLTLKGKKGDVLKVSFQFFWNENMSLSSIIMEIIIISLIIK